LINWEKKGVLKAYRTPGGVRRYKKEDIEKLLGLYDEKQQEQKGKTICYARVSTKKQEEYLQNQVKRLLEYCKQKGYRNILVAIVVSFASRIYGKRGGRREDNSS